MNIKVEIKCVDTSKLPKLTNKEQIDMLRRYKNGELELKDELVNSNLRLVLSLVKKFNNRGECVDDIFQIGVIGLIKAIDNFDISQNVQFSTYAVPMIIGEIKRYLRDNSAFRVTRSIRDLAYKLSQIREEYIKKKSEEPTIDMLCKLAEKDREEVILALDSMTQPMSLNDTIYNDGGDCIFVLDKLRDETDEAEVVTDEIAASQMLDKLTEKERYIIERRYFNDKTQTELAYELGVSQAQISRIEKGAIERIRRKMHN
ncbi:MAG: SigB/SigF/SigG family RNA polymerase sigma factor [Clostridia bacterium]|nr:SigB/SigF/SigG family RNA polymerase sigma factor [Clostridia bacterium]MDD4386352.1 SigB/SigF/SigG family RNA polymerase sigma factor [Clostridia bacterium]